MTSYLYPTKVAFAYILLSLGSTYGITSGMLLLLM